MYQIDQSNDQSLIRLPYKFLRYSPPINGVGVKIVGQDIFTPTPNICDPKYLHLSFLD